MIQPKPIELAGIETLLLEHKEKFDTLCEFLIRENQTVNLTRIIDPDEILIRHFMDSLAAVVVLDLLVQGTSLNVIDIGSGAGFPVLPLAIVRPGWTFTSIEATGKKVDFQKKAAGLLGLKNITFIHGRAEDVAHKMKFREQFDAVTARAVSELAILGELSLGFVKPGGSVLSFKGPAVENELANASKMISLLGGRVESVFQYALPKTAGHFCLIQLMKTSHIQRQYPRSFAAMMKNKAKIK